MPVENMAEKIKRIFAYSLLGGLLLVLSIPIYLERFFLTIYYGMLTWRCGKCGLQLLRTPGSGEGKQYSDHINWWKNEKCVYCKRERTNERQAIFDRECSSALWHTYDSPLESAESKIPQWHITNNQG